MNGVQENERKREEEVGKEGGEVGTNLQLCPGCARPQQPLLGTPEQTPLPW